MAFLLSLLFSIGTVIKLVGAALVPVVTTLATWVMSVLDFIVKRYIKEVKALFDVFPFLVFLTIFVAGGLYFRGPDQVVEKTKYVTKTVTKKVYRTKPLPRVVKPEPNFIEDLFRHPLGW